ncbi:hypothetical protein M569_04516 [Genlisea aurea]|uniref:DUF506 family protein n=1 Tax=Genlisea aurea TaxID=192259 RepID=S8CSH8_9LAMI|nr:hypothetical protein M569_04516 [Genlisea aurea]
MERRTNRVTGFLNEDAKERIFGRCRPESGDVSSGSEHSGEADDGEIFFYFSDWDRGEAAGAVAPEVEEVEEEEDSSVCESGLRDLESIVMRIDGRDGFREVLKSRVVEAAEKVRSLSIPRTEGDVRRSVRRSVMAILRDGGYNAAVCKTRWEKSAGITAGSYEFIDVVDESSSKRYIVELDFCAEFQIARPTAAYQRMLRLLPPIFVGACDEMRQILAAMSESARRSLRSRDLQRPPWRKLRFMQNKWLAAYRRTTNAHAPPSVEKNSTVKCRTVGFDAAVRGEGLFPWGSILIVEK